MSRPRRRPLIHPPLLRAAIGLAVAMLSVWWAMGRLSDGADRVGAIAFFAFALWLPACLITDKYRHKYPQRYDTYLLASHGKAALLMALAAAPLALLGWIPMSPAALGLGLAIFVAADYAISLPRCQAQAVTAAGPAKAATAAAVNTAELAGLDVDASLVALGAAADHDVEALLREEIPAPEPGLSSAVAIRDLADAPAAAPSSVGLVVGTLSLNKVDRLNNYLKHCTSLLAMGGYIALRYDSMESVLEGMKRRHAGWRHSLFYFSHFVRYRALPKIPYIEKIYFAPPFVWFDALAGKARRNRALPKAEVWGRLAYYGIEVLRERVENGSTLLLGRRVSEPVANRKPSFFAIVALEKMGLDGQVIRLHKVRSMYPFSEFLQKKIFQSHGLSNTGKFRDDFRLTDYGPMIRRRWIDEIPGLWDWMRGDVKLVGMRATSPHFLSLYPQTLRDLYIQVKPGLVPPIFDEKTAGFDEIVAVEMAYLTRYLQSPVKTDIQYFWYTFRDIFIRKVRSS